MVDRSFFHFCRHQLPARLSACAVPHHGCLCGVPLSIFSQPKDKKVSIARYRRDNGDTISSPPAPKNRLLPTIEPQSAHIANCALIKAKFAGNCAATCFPFGDLLTCNRLPRARGRNRPSIFPIETGHKAAIELQGRLIIRSGHRKSATFFIFRDYLRRFNCSL